MAKIKRRTKKGQLVMLDGGEVCPKGHDLMQRVGHGDDWKPRPSQPYYFRYWDRCLICNHLQHYEAAKVYLETAASASEE